MAAYLTVNCSRVRGEFGVDLGVYIDRKMRRIVKVKEANIKLEVLVF